MKKKIAVVKHSDTAGTRKVLFVGDTHEECYAYMRTHHYPNNWNDLRYCEVDEHGNITLGRMSSWVLE